MSRCVRWPADLLEPLPHVRGEVPQTDHHPPPQRGETGRFSRLFHRLLSHLALFRRLRLFILAFHSIAGAFDSPSKRGTSRWLGPSAEAGNININIMRPTHAVNMANTANMARAAAPAMQNARAQPPAPRTRPCTKRTRSHQRAGRQAGAGGLGWVPRGGEAGPGRHAPSGEAQRRPGARAARGRPPGGRGRRRARAARRRSCRLAICARCRDCVLTLTRKSWVKERC